MKKNMKSLRLITTIIFLVCSTLIFGCEEAQQILTSAGGRGALIRVGVVLSANSPPSTQYGAKLALAQVNAEGGVEGVPLELVFRAPSTSEGQAAQVVEELITQEQVVAILGPVLPRIALEMAPVAQRHRVPMLSIGAATQEITEAGDYVFLTTFTETFQGKVLAEFARRDLQAETAGLFTQTGILYSETMTDAFERNFTTLGGRIVAREFYSAADTDFTEQLKQLADAEPDVLFMPGFTRHVVAAVNQASRIPQRNASGITATFLGGDGWALQDPVLFNDAINNDPAMAENFYGSDFFPGTISPTVQEFVKAYRSMYGTPPDSLAALGYDAVKLVVTAMRRAGDPDPTAIRDQLAATRDYRGAATIQEYDENRHPIKSLVVLKIADRRVTLQKLIEP